MRASVVSSLLLTSILFGAWVPSRSLAAAPKRSAAVTKLHAEARRIVDEWREAQNRGDDKAYVALYEQRKFRGVKRARKGTTRYDWAGWSTDRLRLMKSHPTVATERITVTTWLEKPSLQRGIVEVRFLQRWKNPRYADHGIKVLLLVRNPSGGLRILYEDLLDSHPGWARQKVARKGGGHLAATSVDEAWRKLLERAPKLEDLDELLATLADDERQERLLASAILKHADPACKEVEEISECGDTRYEWKELDGALPFSNACVQKKAVAWALDVESLRADDLEALQSKLEAIVALPAPEEELIESTFDLVQRRAPKLRLPLLRALVAANKKELADKKVEGLPAAELEVAARELHLDAAAKALSDTKQRSALLAALRDGELQPETRAALQGRVTALTGKDVEQALVEVAEQDDQCSLSMAAALHLESLGKRQYLPRRDDQSDGKSLGRELCRNQHDTNAARRTKFWRSVLPPTGKVLVTDHLDDDFAERDEQGNKQDRPDETSNLRRSSSTPDDLDDSWGAGAVPECSGSTCKVTTSDGYYELEFGPGKDGRTYLRSIYRYHWRGCGC